MLEDLLNFGTTGDLTRYQSKGFEFKHFSVIHYFTCWAWESLSTRVRDRECEHTCEQMINRILIK